MAGAELWCCGLCEMIGTFEQAQGHELNTGHDVRRLTAVEERCVREMWAEEGRSPFDGGAPSGLLGPLLSGWGQQFAARLRGLGGGGGLDGPDF